MMFVRLTAWLQQLGKNERSAEWEGTFSEYLDMVLEQPEIARLAHARIYDMIVAAGIATGPGSTRGYGLFSGRVFGLEEALEQLVNYFESAARRLEIRKRILLMMGPVGGGKSTIVSILKRGLEDYTRSDAGALYTIKGCPMHEEPLHLLPARIRERLLREQGLYVEGELCPMCRWRLRHDWGGDIERAPVRRIVFSEADRVGIGTFVPSDEKCVAGSTYLFTPAGMITIAELHRALQDRPRPGESTQLDVPVLAVDGLRKASRLYNGGRRATRELTTEYGYDLRCSPVHRLLTRNAGRTGWIMASRLKEGMEVAVMVGAKRFGAERSLPRSLAAALGGRSLGLPIKYTASGPRPQWTRELARLAGYIRIGIWDNPIGFGVANNRMAREVSRILADVVPGHIFRAFEYNGEGFVCRSTQAARIVQAFYRAVSSGDGQFSRSLRMGPMDVVLAFVSGLLLNGANVREDSRHAATLSLDTGGTAFLRDVQLALLNAGILARRQRDVLTLNHRAIRRLCDFTPELLIGVGSWVVGERPARVATTSTGASRETRADSSSQEEVRRFHLREAFPREILEGLTSDTSIQLDEVRPVATVVWLELREVKDRIDHVYDLTVPDLHSYCADGFITHNSQDISELVGSVDFSKLGKYGTESDPRAYRFDGELNIANRGLMEFVELLKAPDEFLYGLLSLSQEQSIKAGRFPLTYSDQVVVGHTNEVEYRAFAANDRNEALKDRILLIRVPYNLRVTDEERIYKKLLGEGDLRGIHMAPHALEIASMFAVLTRLEPSNRPGLSLLKKLRLYDGREVDGFSVDDVRQIRQESEHEGMSGLSPRYVMNCLSQAIARSETGCVTPIDVLCALKDGMAQHPGLGRELRDQYLKLLYETRNEYDQIARAEVQAALLRSVEEHAQTLADSYLENVRSYCSSKKEVDPLTGKQMPPDEELMRSIEEQIGITESARRAFREELVVRITALDSGGRCFDYRAHGPLREAVESRLLKELRGALRIGSSARRPDTEHEYTVRRLLSRLCSEYGYCKHCAGALVAYVGNLLNA